VKRRDDGVVELAVGEVEMRFGVGQLGVEAFAARCRLPGYSGQKSSCCSAVGSSSRVEKINSSASPSLSLWTE
jgi:hypothetical protein